MVMERGECQRVLPRFSEDDATNDDVKRRMKPQLSSGIRKVLWVGEASKEDDEVDNCDTLWDEDIEPATVGDNVGIRIE